MTRFGVHTRRVPGQIPLPEGVRVLTVGKVRRSMTRLAANENTPPLRWRLAHAGRRTVRTLSRTWPWLVCAMGTTVLALALS